jgi:hypothetical protein
MNRDTRNLLVGSAIAIVVGFSGGYFFGSRPADQHMSAAEGLTLFALFGQLGVFAFQWRLMREQLRVSAGAEERALRHDRLTVRPYLDCFSETLPGELKCAVWNHGNGVAIITSLTIFLDDKPMVSESGDRLIWAIVEALGWERTLLDQLHSRVNWMAPPSALKAGGEFVLVHLRFTRRANPHDVLKRLRFEVEYQSLYGELFNARSDGPPRARESAEATAAGRRH